MKRLVIIRHAHAKHSGHSDFERELNNAGAAEAIAAGKALFDAGVVPDLIFSSPSRRTTATVDAIAAVLDIHPSAIVFELDLYGGDEMDVLRLVGNAPDRVKTIFVVGHNPTMLDVINALADIEIDHLPPAGTVLLEFSIDSWQNLAANHAVSVKVLFPK